MVTPLPRVLTNWCICATQRVNLAQNNIIDPEPLVNLVNLPSMRYLSIKGNDMRAAQVQQVQDAADEKPNMRLVRQ